MKYIGKEALSSDDNSSSVKNKSFNSAFNDKNNLLLSNKKIKIDNNKNNLKSGKNTKIFQFQEEENIKGDKRHKKKKKRKIKNKKDEVEVKDSDDMAQDNKDSCYLYSGDRYKLLSEKSLQAQSSMQ